MSDSRPIASMFPGRVVTIESDTGDKIEVRVYPLGVAHIPRYKTMIESALRSGLAEWNRPGASPTDIAAAVLPVLAAEGLDLLKLCTEGVDLDNPRLPAWVLPKILVEFLDESFGTEKKARPWVDILDWAIQKATGGKAPRVWTVLQETSKTLSSTLSEHASRLGTLSTTFSAARSSPATEAGPSPGSGSSDESQPG